jgi:hypothetical protein
MPRKTLIITDVTKMSGNSVCIAGYDSTSMCIRPVLFKTQIKKEYLFKNNSLIIYPSAKVSFEFIHKDPQPPHTEDYIFDKESIEYESKTTVKEWREVLDCSARQTFDELFPSLEGRCVLPGATGHSIGTLIPSRIPIVHCDNYNPQRPRPRMDITDWTGIDIEWIPINDLAFWSLFMSAVSKARGNCHRATEILNKTLIDKKIYLRLGLTRAFAKPSEPHKKLCWLQVNGIHTFPDLYDREYAEWIRLD